MANVNVSYGELQTGQNQLQAGKQEMIDALQRLQGNIDALVSSGFQTDTASGAFQNHYMQFQQGMQHALLGLDGMQAFLQRAEQTLVDADTQLRSQLS